MLQVFRDNLKGLAPVLWLVIIAFVAIEFSVFGRNLGGPGVSDAATVGSYNVTITEFQNQYRQLESRYRQTFGESFTPELAKQMGLHQQALDSAINAKILIAEADRMGLEPTPGEIQEVILNDPNFQDDTGHFVGADEYRQKLQRNYRQTPESYEENIREALMNFKLQSVLSDTIFISDSEIEVEARKNAERANIRFVQLNGASLASEVEVSDEEIQARFDSNPDDYRLPEQRRAGYLSIPVNVIRAELEIPEADMRAYYDANQSEFTQEEQVRARQILLFADGTDRDEAATRALAEQLKQRIEGGEDFAALATEFSEDQVTKARGGDLGFFVRGSYTPAFEQAVFAAAPNTLVGPIDNTLGTRKVLHLVEVLQKREGGVQPFEQVQNTINVRLLNDRARQVAEERANELATRLETETPGDEDALRALASEEGIAYESLQPFGLDDNLQAIGRRTEFSTQVFDLEPGVYGTATRVPAGWAIPVLFEVIEPRLPELAEIRGRVRQDVVAEKQVELALQRLAEGKEALEDGKSIDEIATDLGVPATDSGLFGETGSISGIGVQPEVNKAALALDQGQFGGPVKTATGAVLFEVTERQRFDPVSFSETKEALHDQMASQRLSQMLSSLINQRRQEYKIRLSQQVQDLIAEASNPDAGAGG